VAAVGRNVGAGEGVASFGRDSGREKRGVPSDPWERRRQTPGVGEADLKRSTLYLVLAVLFGARAVVAEDARPAPWALEVALEPVAELGAVTIPCDKRPVAREMVFPAVPFKPGTRVVLRFSARADGRAPEAIAHGLGIRLNGPALPPTTREGRLRLLNRSPTLRYGRRGGIRFVPWWGVSRAREPALLIFVGAGGEPDERIRSDREEGYWYLFDITDLVRRPKDVPEKDRPRANRLVLSNHLLRRLIADRDAPVTIEGATVGYVPASAVKELTARKDGRRGVGGEVPKTGEPDEGQPAAP